MAVINPVYQFTRPETPFLGEVIDLEDAKTRHCIYVYDGDWSGLLDNAIFYLGEYGWVKEMKYEDFVSNFDKEASIDGGLTFFIRNTTYKSHFDELPGSLGEYEFTGISDTVYKIDYK